MAAADKLWFELGVRDEISGVLEKLMRNSEKLANALSDDAAELKNVYQNIVDVSNVYDKIYIAQKRISELKGTNLTRDERKGLKNMSSELENVRKQFTEMFKDPDRLLNKGEVKFDKLRLNIELMLKDTLRYVDNIEAKEAAEAKNAANESRRIDDRGNGHDDDDSSTRAWPSRTSWGGNHSVAEKLPFLFTPFMGIMEYGWRFGYTSAQIDLMIMDQPTVEYGSDKDKRGKKSMIATKQEEDEMKDLVEAWKKDRNGKTYAGKTFSLNDFMEGKVE